MSFTFISLFYLGLSLGQEMEVYNERLSKPHLQALTTPVVAPGGDVTLQCSLPPQSYPQKVTFFLQKLQNTELLQSKTGEWTKTDFLLFFLRPQDTGKYHCMYQEITGSYRVSEPSETLTLWVTEALPKPFLTATSSQLVVSGTNVTLFCWGPIRGVGFALYKEGEESFVGIRESTQDGDEFLLTHVNINHTGNYSCRYDVGLDSNVTTTPSDLLELTLLSQQDISFQHISKTKVSRYIWITLRHLVILFFLFLFLAFLCNHHT
ncbi:immunoglobulin superfamily member 1-like [Macrotis lagotis]|uniref:immunoglobulin superfamily member 1-like n=1 Tax=Macrotis lagotis TaxID=92651 RepID=UPI003D68C192